MEEEKGNWGGLGWQRSELGMEVHSGVDERAESLIQGVEVYCSGWKFGGRVSNPSDTEDSFPWPVL